MTTVAVAAAESRRTSELQLHTTTMASGEDAVLDFATFKEEFDAFTEFAFAPTDTELGDTRGPWGPWLDELACKKIGSELK